MFTTEIISKLKQQSILVEHSINNENVYSLNKPARLIFDESITEIIRSNYKADEEIGGLLWINPEQSIESGIILKVEKISFIRNAIEDNQRRDNKSKKNAYLFDRKEFLGEYSNCIKQGFLPIKFHTHPTDGIDLIEEWRHTIRNWETSQADISEAQLVEIAELNYKVMLPRVLIVGYGNFTGEFFYGIYGGMISPNGFKESKDIVQKEHFENFFNKAKTIQLNDKDKILLFAGLAFLIFIVIRYKKTSIPILTSLGLLAPALLTSTDSIESAKYFSKTKRDKIEILIP